ncbi:SPW repeat domain-containing protein [Microvirga roseola]|uniref:SPW repeat domain-containing protein n=1 Tax=Microvirga roseola TaxID=2883126 RepID=UPI001E575500|nr:SPW repeat protein [Microvirga roseola]
MRFIPTRVHGVIDYLTGLLLIAAPFVLGFADGGAAQWVPMIVGAGILIMSLMTDYELSLAHLIPLPVHLGVDAIGGLLLLVSPWLFGFADFVFWPHVIIGLMEIGVALTTHTTPDTAEVGARRHYG